MFFVLLAIFGTVDDLHTIKKHHEASFACNFDLSDKKPLNDCLVKLADIHHWNDVYNNTPKTHTAVIEDTTDYGFVLQYLLLPGVITHYTRT